MNSLLLCLVLFTSVFGDLTCESNQVYVKMIKTSYSYPQEEKVHIYDGETVVLNSPNFAGTTYSNEFCISATVNSQYTVKLVDTYGDGWSDGSYVRLEGKYGVSVFVGNVPSGAGDSYPLSLYMPVDKNAEWKFVFNTVSGSWKDVSYDDSTWNTVTLGNVQMAVNGNQYFRKSFVGLNNMAAYQFAFNYRFGIVAYINGYEIYRDNMPAGEITPTTAATGSYMMAGFRSVIRPASEVKEANSVLSVEIHFQNLAQTFVDFDAYLTIVAPDIKNTDCFMYADEHAITREGDSQQTKIWDYKYTQYYSKYGLPVNDFIFSLNGPKAYINGIAIWANANYNYLPKKFTWEGKFNSETEYTTIISEAGVTYNEKKYYTFGGFFSANTYDSYRLNVLESGSTSVYIYELIPLICSTKYPTSITFEQESYSYYAVYESVFIRPTLSEFTNCQISPALPQGIVLDTNTCTVSGSGNAALPATTYTITSSVEGLTFTGSFTLELTSCNHKFIRILRTYKGSPTTEYFDIFDPVANTTLYSVAKNSGQPANQDVSAYLCTDASKLEVNVMTSSSYWQFQSFIYVYYLFESGASETLLRAQKDKNYGYPDSFTVSLDYPITAGQNWYYKMGEVPANWYNSEVSGWTEKPSSGYPDSTNQIQLYKKQFTVASLEGKTGVVISLKYQYGVIIYLNGNEVFRKGVEGALSTESFSTTSLNDVKFRQISLPLSGSYKGAAYADFITTGTNTIAVALIAPNAVTKTSTFDCAIHLLESDYVYRNFDYTVALEGSVLNTNCNYIFETHYSKQCSYTQCGDHAITITFDNDRHEWISSVAMKLYYTQKEDLISGFTLEGKNSEDETWTLVKSYSNISFTQQGQRSRFWTFSTQAFNQYRIRDITGIPGERVCRIKFNSFEFLLDSMTVDVPALAYEDAIIYKNIEMAEVYPSSDYYADFSVNPPLPTGLILDVNNGMISGRTSVQAATQVYTISAKKYNGIPVTATFSLAVNVCFGGKSLITLAIRTDNYPSEMLVTLYEGKGNQGNIIINKPEIPVKNSMYYIDQCLVDGIYTYEFTDKYDGWDDPAGYFLSLDSEQFRFAVGQVPHKNDVPTVPSVSFSTYLPFQIEYSDWKVNKEGGDIASNWNAIDFDDSTWFLAKAADIGTTESITTYIRKEFTLTNITNYNLLNVRMKYKGGVVAYLNGNKVARFNLVDRFDEYTESIAVHDQNVYSQFHVLLDISGAVEGKNVMAFEIHRPVGISSAEPVVFDATGMFDVNDCAFALDSYSDIHGSPLLEGSDYSVYLDMNFATRDTQENAVGSYLEWTVENLEGTKFNTFGIGIIEENTGLGFSFYVRDDDNEPYTGIVEELNLELGERIIHTYAAGVAIAGYNQFKFEIDAAPEDTLRVFDFIQLYCRAAGEGICPSVDGYPAVGEGQISPGECEYGYSGYTYRECHDGVLGEIKTDKCVMKVPADITYAYDSFTLVKDTNVNIAAPNYRNIITKFYLAPNVNLPKGLALDEATGAIRGMPTEEMEKTAYTIYGENEQGAGEVVITLFIRKGECKAESNFAKTVVGEVAVFECSSIGDYIGTQTRACKLGVGDGEWEKTSGVCMSYTFVIVMAIIIVIVVIIIAVLIIKNKKVKAVGAVKGKVVKKNLEKKVAKV